MVVDYSSVEERYGLSDERGLTIRWQSLEEARLNHRRHYTILVISST